MIQTEEDNYIEFKYFNLEKLSICDFIEEIKEDLLKNLSKNREYFSDVIYFYKSGIVLENNISVNVEYYAKDDNYYFEGVMSLYKNKDFAVDGISVNEFVKELLENANEYYFKEEYNYYYNSLFGCWVLENHEALDHFYKNGVYLAYYDKKCNIDAFDKKFFIKKLRVSVFLNEYKIAHKEAFYKNLHNDLIKAAWRPKRVVDWCYDIEEQEIFNSLPDE